jgi:ribosomal protein L37E
MPGDVLFSGRRLVIATMHGKERVIAPLLEKVLGLQTLLCPELNTDEFGTFSGEVERIKDPLNTARDKCKKAMELLGCDLGIASEGSFGPHPSLFMVAADEEWLVLIDRKNGLEIIAKVLSTDTNFFQGTLHTEEELMEFAEKALFPTHGLILRGAKEGSGTVYKGLHDEKELKKLFHSLLKRHGEVDAATDMRAMHNPSRMQVIEKATQQLLEKIASVCPQCSTPGFAVVKAHKGLPCSLCGLPTASIRSYTWACTHCGYEKEEAFPHQKTEEDPMYCVFCNP